MDKKNDTEDNKDDEKKDISFSFITGPPAINDNWHCPVCTRIFRNPVRLNNDPNFTFCHSCIDKWCKKCVQMGNRPTNPMTGLPIKKTDKLYHDTKLLKDIKFFFQKVADKMNESPLYINGQELPKKSAKDAQKFFEEHLKHLKPEYETYSRWSEWIAESWYNMCYQLRESDESKQDFRERLDNLKEEAHRSIDNIFEERESEIENAQTDQERAVIIEQIEQDVSFFTKLLKGIVKLCKYLWKKFKEGVAHVKYCVNLLYGWISGFIL